VKLDEAPGNPRVIACKLYHIPQPVQRVLAFPASRDSYIPKKTDVQAKRLAEIRDLILAALVVWSVVVVYRHHVDTGFIVATIIHMKIEFDPEKNARNIELRGISFEEAAEFEWHSALVTPDTRRDYGEPRYRAFGFIGNRLYAMVFAPREGAVRVISLRKANRREVLRYETQSQS
jgi:hypothetical protein